jgi:methylmalonyl-CoA/ethylmalonyl-CoA epimerase
MSSSMRFHHVGLACTSISREKKSLELLGYRAESPEFVDPTQRVRGQFMVLGDSDPMMRIELLEPAAAESPVEPFLARGGGMYHQCLEVPHLEQALADMRAGGYLLVQPPVSAVAFGGRRIAFLMSRTGRLVELLEEFARP